MFENSEGYGEDLRKEDALYVERNMLYMYY
jgi:hypothetical protein